MNAATPDVDYVRIEIHTAGQAEIIELRPDDNGWGKVRAQLITDDRPDCVVEWGRLTRPDLRIDVNLTLKVSGPTATYTRKALREASI